MGGHAISLKEKRKMTENVIWQPNKVSAKDRYRVLGQKGLVVWFTGLSGSGKSSLAFDTIYAEGQRRYMESLSSYARQFLSLIHI